MTEVLEQIVRELASHAAPPDTRKAWEDYRDAKKLIDSAMPFEIEKDPDARDKAIRLYVDLAGL